jgi:hypothetical protein
MRDKIVIGVVLFILGVMVGNLSPLRTAMAQAEPGQAPQPDNWVLQPIDKGNVWAYLLNTSTGQIFTVYGTDKAEVKPETKKTK